MTPAPYDAVVLAGGSGRRLGGVDKPALLVGGTTLLDLALAAVSDASRVVVVGPERALPPAVVQVREQPPGGGPAAALGAALPHVHAGVAVVLAADLPSITGAVVAALREAAVGHDGALLVDDEGQDQLLTAAWSTGALRSALPGRDLSDRPLRPVLSGLEVARVRAADLGLRGWADCDTAADLDRARREASA